MAIDTMSPTQAAAFDATISGDTIPAPGRAPVGTPDWWRDRLHAKLRARAAGLAVYDSYYGGAHPLAFASKKFRDAFGGLFREFADNWTQLVVDAVRERLGVQGFRLGDEAEGDTDAWEIWQANQLDSESQIAHSESLIYGISYALVWPGEDDKAEVTIESPLEVIEECAPGYRRNRVAAYKEWRDDWEGLQMATLYLPDEVYKWRSEKPLNALLGNMDTIRWIPREVEDEDWPLPNPLRKVPVVPLPNRPRLLNRYESEIRGIIPIQDAVNKLVADLLTASEYGAFPQRYATGLEVETDETTGRPIEPIKAAIDRLWINENAEGKFGAFPSTDLSNFVEAIQMFVQHAASQTRTPPHYFFLRGEFPSGESIVAAETGLVAKVKEKQLFLGEAWEEVIGLSFLAAQKFEKAKLAFTAETIWKDPESRSESEHVDATVKKKALGIPDEALWEDLDYSPAQIARFLEMRERQAALMPEQTPAVPELGIPAGPGGTDGPDR